MMKLPDRHEVPSSKLCAAADELTSAMISPLFISEAVAFLPPIRGNNKRRFKKSVLGPKSEVALSRAAAGRRAAELQLLSTTVKKVINSSEAMDDNRGVCVKQTGGCGPSGILLPKVSSQPSGPHHHRHLKLKIHSRLIADLALPPSADASSLSGLVVKQRFIS